MKTEPTMREESLRTQIALGWTINLVILCMMFIFMIVQSALANNAFHALHRDPGSEGMRMLVYMVPYYALMPLYVFWASGLRWRVLRWIAVASAGLGCAYFMLHHLSHWVLGERPDFNSSVLDLTLHVVGLWVLIKSVKWAKLPVAVPETEKVSLPSNAVFQRS